MLTVFPFADLRATHALLVPGEGLNEAMFASPANGEDFTLEELQEAMKVDPRAR